MLLGPCFGVNWRRRYNHERINTATIITSNRPLHDEKNFLISTNTKLQLWIINVLNWKSFKRYAVSMVAVATSLSLLLSLIKVWKIKGSVKVKINKFKKKTRPAKSHQKQKKKENISMKLARQTIEWELYFWKIRWKNALKYA